MAAPLLFLHGLADIMERAIAAVHVPRWAEWEALEVPTLAVFAKDGMFSAEDKDELIRRRPITEWVDLGVGRSRSRQS